MKLRIALAGLLPVLVLSLGLGLTPAMAAGVDYWAAEAFRRR